MFVLCDVWVLLTTSESVPLVMSSAEPFTIGVAELPADVTGIHVSPPGCRTLPTGIVHVATGSFLKSADLYLLSFVFGSIT